MNLQKTTLTACQDKALSKSYDWLLAVLNKQKRWLPNELLWYAYPFKRTGLSKYGLEVLIAKMKAL